MAFGTNIAMNLQVLIVTLTICADVQHVLSVEYSPIVQLTNGKVRGLVKDVQPSGEKVYFYEGIRYGYADRFSAPKPVEPWTNVYNATMPRDSCPQHGIQTISEDCLFLNIWKPTKESLKPRSVMVFIHGGAYAIGTIFTSSQDCSYISSQGDVIVVTINYRLGAFGFLFGDTNDAPGNLGLRDQILALHWVKENIGHFGGDPNMVTVFGESAGSFAVGSLILSPLAKGLFIRAIMQSGGPISSLAKTNQNAALQLTKKLAHSVSCPSETIQTSLDCLRHNKTINQVLSLPAISTTDLMAFVNYLPIYGDEVLPYSPEEALKTGKFNQGIDLMYGVTSNEASNTVMTIISMSQHNENLTLETTKDIIKGIFSKSNYSSEVASFYTTKLKNNPTQAELKIAIGDAFGDYTLGCPTILFGEELSKHLSIKHSTFSYRLTKPTLVYPCWIGVCHSEDMIYLFDVPKIASNPKLFQLSHDMIRAWTEFAKTGKPTKMGNVAWSPANDQNNGHNQHMNLHPDDYKMVKDFYKETCDSFWKPKFGV